MEDSSKLDNYKLLFYISTIRGGGAARVMTNIANAFCEKGIVVVFVTNFNDSHEYYLKENIKRLNIEKSEDKRNFLLKNTSRIMALRRIIRDEKPDVCISFMGENNFRLICATRRLRTRTIISVRNDPEREYSNKIHKILAKLLFPKADGVVFQTEDAKAWFPHRVQEKSRVIFNQVDEKFFCKNPEIGQYIVACGRLSKQKNYKMLLNAFAQVIKVFPNEELRIYGEGELKDELIEYTKMLGINNSVYFMGFSTNMEKVYENAKLMVMTSTYEGMPNAILEALASSVPVISTDCPCGGPRMVISNGVNGFLVPVDSVEALVEKIICVLKDNSIILKMKEKAYAMSQNYRSDIVISSWISFIESVQKDKQNIDG